MIVKFKNVRIIWWGRGEVKAWLGTFNSDAFLKFCLGDLLNLEYGKMGDSNFAKKRMSIGRFGDRHCLTF